MAPLPQGLCHRNLAGCRGNHKESPGKRLMLDQFDSGEANFWSDIHQPFKNSLMTRDTAKSLILAAKERYQTNLPGLAVKLRACKDRSHIESEERKKFLSFKNFLYKTVRISTN